MVSTQNISFGVYALLTRIIPGGITLLVFLATPAAPVIFQANIQIPQPRVALFGGLIISYVVGSMINFVRTVTHPVPYPFLKLLYIESEREEFLPPTSYLALVLKRKFSGILTWIQRRFVIQLILKLFNWTKSLGRTVIAFVPFTPRPVFKGMLRSPRKLHKGIGDDLEPHLGINLQTQSADEIYEIMTAYLEPNLTPETRNRKRLVQFWANLSVALIIVLVTGTLTVLFQIMGIQDYESPIVVGALLLIVVTLPSLYLVSPLLAIAERRYVHMLVVEYYISRFPE
jgi:hypothetical protein